MHLAANETMAIVKKDSLHELRICQANAETKYLGKFPDFFILGPQRTGTTWLAKNLQQHPEVFVTEPKELYYFSALDKPTSQLFVSTKLEWYLQHFHESAFAITRKQLATLKRFKTLYTPRVRGEGTATYAAGISDVAINDLMILNPDIKCILMIRNPIQRAWAHAKKDLMNVSEINQKERDVGVIGEEEMLSFIHNTYQLKCGRYGEQIERWESLLKPGNLFIGFFDELTEDPISLLLSLYSFLGVRSDARLIPDLVRTKIGRTDNAKNASSRKMPSNIQSALKALFDDELRMLEARFSRKFEL
jgi:hypothetical protein